MAHMSHVTHTRHVTQTHYSPVIMSHKRNVTHTQAVVFVSHCAKEPLAVRLAQGAQKLVVCCSMLRCGSVVCYWCVFYRIAECRSVLQCVAVCCCVLLGGAVCCCVLLCGVVCRSLS